MTAKRVVTMGFVFVIAMAALLSIAFTQDKPKEIPKDHSMMMSKSPMEGTWRFVSSTLGDGTVLKPPQIRGLLSLNNGLRNFNVYQKGPDGKVFSISSISKYVFTDTSWTETQLYRIMNDEFRGTPLTYSTKEVTMSAPIKKDGMKLTVKPPFDPPTLVFEGDKMTATLAGEFVDVWERVK